MGNPDWRIREFTAADYPGVAAVTREMYPDFPQTEDELRDDDARRDPRCRWRRWVVEADGRIVGYAFFTQLIGKYDPDRYNIGGGVRAECRGLGIGTALYDRVRAELDPLKPRQLRAQAREDRTVAIDFLTRRGYALYRHERDWALDVSAFDASPYAGLEDRLGQEGIEIRTLRELESDPQRDRKLYDLDWEVTRDEPGSADDTRVDFETFVREGINASVRLPDGYFVAVRGDEYVGVCILNAIKSNGAADHGITGVTRGYRRRGIATAMKVRAIDYARQAGIPTLYTFNDNGNSPMLAINEKLGFVSIPGWKFFEKKLRSD